MDCVKTYLWDVLDVGVLVSLGVFFGVIKKKLWPIEWGFFCSDTTIRLPYHKSTVPTTVNQIVSYCVPLVFLIIIHYWRNIRRTNRWRPFFNDVKQLFFYGLVTQTVTHIIKNAMGRLRPHFIDVCRPNIEFTEQTCGDFNCPLYIANYSCAGNPDIYFDPVARNASLIEGRLSFPSGHSSTAFYGMVLAALILYRTKISFLGVHVIQIICLVYCSCTAVSRVTDHKHHKEDVLAGSLLGIIFALVAASRLSTQRAAKPGEARAMVETVEDPEDSRSGLLHEDFS